LLVPEVRDLTEFAVIRPIMTPSTGKECQIASNGDAALQVQRRLRDENKHAAKSEKNKQQRTHETRAKQLQRSAAVTKARANVKAKNLIAIHGLPGCHTSTFRPTAWSTQQKSRVDTLLVPPGDDTRLDRFDIAWTKLPPRVRTRVVTETSGRGKKATKTEREEHFLANSLVRPLVADNLARARRWYEGFVVLFTRIDPVSKKPLWRRLFFEKEGLYDMTQTPTMWEDRGESAVVRAVHEALRRRFGAIASENKGRIGTMKNRMSGEFDRWRLAFAGAKTADQFRQALCDLFGRAGMNATLRSDWEFVLPWLADTNRWQLTRDLALLGLASYPKRAGEPDAGNEEEDDASSD
jgi:CRISPR-associated protein Cas8a1/Csx13